LTAIDFTRGFGRLKEFACYCADQVSTNPTSCSLYQREATK